MILFLLASFTFAKELPTNVETSTSGLPFSAAYNESFARTLAFYAASSYCPSDSIADWSCRFCDSNTAPPLSNVTLLWNASTQVSGYIGYDKNAGTLVLAFRGSVGLENWLEDFDITLLDIPCAPSSGCKVSAGFYYVTWASVRDQVLDAIHTMSQSFGASGSASLPLILTGHSLGAAIAEVAAWDLSTRFDIQIAAIITFGTPRTGNEAWANSLALTAPPISFRIVHAYDPVPHLPPEFVDYKHAPREVFYPQSGNGTNFTVCSQTDGEDSTCSDSILPIFPKDHNFYLNISIDDC
jgi:hypothetical protein